jgi:hypothetical protein
MSRCLERTPKSGLLGAISEPLEFPRYPHYQRPRMYVAKDKTNKRFGSLDLLVERIKETWSIVCKLCQDVALANHVIA